MLCAEVNCFCVFVIEGLSLEADLEGSDAICGDELVYVLPTGRLVN